MIHRNGRKLFEKVKNDFMEQYTFPTDTNELESYKRRRRGRRTRMRTGRRWKTRCWRRGSRRGRKRKRKVM